MLTGDTVLGRGTTVVAHPDGQLGAYLDSLDRLHALAEAHEIGTIWPGHGPVIDDALGALDYYIAHRAERLEQVESALAELQARAAPRRDRRRRAAAPGRRDRLRRRRPGAVGRRRALGARPAGPPRRPGRDAHPGLSLEIGHTANKVTAAGIPFRGAGQVGDGSLRGAARGRLGRRFPLVPRRPRAPAPTRTPASPPRPRPTPNRAIPRSPAAARTAVPDAGATYTGQVSVARGAQGGRRQPDGRPAPSRSRCRPSPPSRWPPSTCSAAPTPGRAGQPPGFGLRPPADQRCAADPRPAPDHRRRLPGVPARPARARSSSRAKGWEMYPGLSMGRRAGENSVAWRSDTWEMVRPGLIPIPYFNGRIRPMPYVLLRHKQTGVQAYFSTFHNPANIGGNMQRFRTEATTPRDQAVQLARDAGHPAVRHRRHERARRSTSAASPARLRSLAAAGGSNDGGCSPPKPTQIDWIFGSPGAVRSQNYVDRPQPARASYDGPPGRGRDGDDRRDEVQERLRPDRS